MLAKSKRLTTREFSAVMVGGALMSSFLYSVRYIPATSFKASPAVSKKIWKTAAARNAVKRKIYAILQEIISKKTPRPFFVVLVVREPFDRTERADAIYDLEGLFVKAGIMQ